MSRPLLLVVALACGDAAVAQRIEPEATVEPSAAAPRNTLLEWQGELAKPFWYRLPKKIDAKRPPNLLVMLCGDGLDHTDCFVGYPVFGDFRRDDIIASPGGSTLGITSATERDHEQIAALIDVFRRRVPIANVYLYGHGTSANLCCRFAGRFPELVDGVVAHGGNPTEIVHTRLSRTKVAIGILHGRFDHDVPAACAVLAEKTYRAEGHEKVRLLLVDERDPRRVRGAMPNEVARLLEWFDEVSVPTLPQSTALACLELRRDEPDLAVIVEQVDRARALLPKAGADEKLAEGPRLAALVGFLERCVQVYGDTLLADAAASAAKPEPGPWVVPFLRAHAAFAGEKEWKQAVGTLCDLAARHDRLLDKARQQVGRPGKGARAAAVKAWSEAWLAADGVAFGRTLAQALRDAGDDELAVQVEEELSRRTRAASEGDEAWAVLTKRLFADLREAHAELFADPDAAK